MKLRKFWTMMAAAIPVETRGVSENVPTQMPKSPAPAKPPTLQSACMPLMRRRPAAFSQKAAWQVGYATYLITSAY